MNNSELDHLLTAAPLPERPADYWADFPQTVTRRLRAGQSSAFRRPEHRLHPYLLWSFGLATACVLIGFAIGFWRGHESGLQASQVAAMRTYFREIETLFPNQIRAIVIDEKGPHLVLAEKPDVPSSMPLLLNIRGPSGSQSVLTFSGQQIPVDGELCDVLADAQGHVLLVGKKLVWSSEPRGLRKAPVRIQAQALNTL